MSSHLRVPRRVVHLLAGAVFAFGCSAAEPTAPALSEPEREELSSRWAAEFSAAGDRGDRGIAEVAARYLEQVPSDHADELAVMFGTDTFTRAGMREALVTALNALGQYEDASAELARLVVESPDAVPASRIAYLRALNLAGIPAREGVLTPDLTKRDVLIDAMLLARPTLPDAWSELYDYHLGVMLFTRGRTSETASLLLPLIGDADVPVASEQLDNDLLGSALNMAVQSLAADGDLERADALAARLVRFDDAHHLNFSGRHGADTHLPSSSK